MRLIDADRLRSAMWYAFGEQDEYFNKGMAKWDSGLWVRYKAVEEVIDAQPTIEAEPVKHGEWLIDRSGSLMCSKCGTLLDEFQKPSRFCPNCGAKMDK